MPGARLGLVFLNDATPEQMPDVGAQGIDLAFFSVQRKSKELLFRNPEILIEPVLEFSGLFLQSPGSFRIAPEFTGEPGTTALRVIDVSLYLASRDRHGCKRSIRESDGVPRVFPALVLDSGFFVAALVLNIPITVTVAVFIDPLQCCPGFCF